jgi:hypothetical protein
MIDDSTTEAAKPPPVNHVIIPFALTEEKSQQFCYWVSRGIFIEPAAERVGLGKSSVWRWLKQGKKDIREGRRDTPLAAFVRDVKKALAYCECEYMDRFQAEKNWMKWAWLMERRFPKRWGRHRLEMGAPKEKDRLDGPYDDPGLMDEIKRVLEGSSNGQETNGA